MSNKVVLGDLSLYKGNTSLKFDGVNDRCSFPVLGVGSDFTVEMDIIPYEVISNGFLFHPRAERDYYLRVVGGEIRMSSWNGSSNSVTLATGIQVGVKYSIVCTISGTNLSATVNGVSVTGTLPVGNLTSNTNLLGSQDGVLNNFKGEICCCKITTSTTSVDYIQNGDFGDVTLIDHSGNGNDGTIIGATWWMQDINQQFDDPLTYRSQLPVTPVEVQVVTYTDATPYYPTNDPFWGAYDENWLVVSDQSGGGFTKIGQMALKMALIL